jgi:hypothetical protein
MRFSPVFVALATWNAVAFPAVAEFDENFLDLALEGNVETTKAMIEIAIQRDDPELLLNIGIAMHAAGAACQPRFIREISKYRVSSEEDRRERLGAAFNGAAEANRIRLCQVPCRWYSTVLMSQALLIRDVDFRQELPTAFRSAGKGDQLEWIAGTRRFLGSIYH